VRPAAVAASAGDVNTCAGPGLASTSTCDPISVSMSRPRWLNCLSRSTFTGTGGDVDHAEQVEKGLGGCARRWKRGNGDHNRPAMAGTARRRIGMAISVLHPEPIRGQLYIVQVAF
jgi:hypothetical protein